MAVRNESSVMESLASNYCLNETEMRLSGNEYEQFVYRYIVLIFVLFGTVGNILVLIILLLPPMRSRSRSFCFLAIFDILFLVFMFPHSLANYKMFADSYYFRLLYLNAKMHLIACSNWISASAIWLVLLICTERLLGVRYPLYMKEYSTTGNKKCAFLTLFIIVTSTGLLTMYTHIMYHAPMKIFCHGTQPHALFISVDSEKWPQNRSNPNPKWLQQFVRWNAHIHATFVVLIPTVIIAIANIALLITLRQRSHTLLMFNDSTKSGSRLTSQARIEQKITYSACAIVTCFTVTQAPSVLLPTILGNPTFRGPEWKMNLQIVTNCMVVIGKSLNFALFCLSSKTFRQRLVEVCQHILQCKSFRQLMLQSSSFPLSNTTRNTAIVDGSSCKSEANQRPTSSGAIYLRKVRRSLPSIRYSDIRRSSKNVTIIRPRTLSMVQI